MKIAVIGAGIVGITTAYELARDGHEVTVFERRSAAAEEASFANAGVLSPGYITPWAAPGVPTKILKQMLQKHAAFRLKLPLTMHDMAWLWQFWRACKPKTYQANRSALQQLALASRQQMHAIIERHDLQFDRQQGYLIALRSDKERTLMQPSLQVLQDLGMPFEQLDEAQARLIEPAINADTRFAGAIHLAHDEVANCRQFALLLKDQCRRMGVEFTFNTEVHKIDLSAPTPSRQASDLVKLTLTKSNLESLFSALSGTSTIPGDRQPTQPQEVVEAVFDATVLCTGVQSQALLKPLGIKLPLTAIYGYSVSFHVKEMLDAPRSGLMDERYKVSITRLGQRVRVAGSAQLGGTPGTLHTASLNTLYKVLQDWFPGAAVMSKGVQHWQGARPMLANRPPVIGAGNQPGLWLNLGHGSSGWALSCASARLLADQLSAQTTVNAHTFHQDDESGLALDAAPFALSKTPG